MVRRSGLEDVGNSWRFSLQFLLTLISKKALLFFGVENLLSVQSKQCVVVVMGSGRELLLLFCELGMICPLVSI